MIVNPDNVDGWNVADQEAKEKEGKENVLGFYRQMIGTRKAHKDVLVCVFRGYPSFSAAIDAENRLF